MKVYSKVLIVVISSLVLVVLAYISFNYWTMRGVKTPAYQVLTKQGNIELRHYQPMLVAVVTVTGSRQAAVREGFKILADYIFGNNHVDNGKRSKIAMTSPVLQQSDSQTISMTSPVMQQASSQKISMTSPVIEQANSSNSWQVEFVMPSEYTMSSIPKPNNQQIKLVEVAAKKVLAIRFTGRADDRLLANKQAKLMAYVKHNELTSIGEARYAFYNPPWILPFMRRNEVLIDIA